MRSDESVSGLSRRQFLGGSVLAAGGLALAHTGSRVASAAPTVRLATGAPFGPGDLRFVGAFEFPADVAGQDAAWGSTLAVRYVGNERRLFSATVPGNVYEVRHPGLSLVAPYPRAPLVRMWGDVTSGARLLVGRSGTGSLNGLYWDEPTQLLYWSYGDGYNTASAHDPSVGRSRLLDGGNAEPQGAWVLGDRSCKMTMGGVTAIPPAFAEAYCNGRRLAAGFGGYYSIVALGPASMGPALAAFSPTDLGQVSRAGGRVPVTELVGYPFNPTPYTQPDRCHRSTDYRDDFDGWNPRNGVGYWTWSDYIGQAGTWIEIGGRSCFLVVADIATGRVWYETSTLHAEGAQHWCFVYDAADLARVALGQRRQWEIQPAAMWEIRFPGIDYPRPGWANGPFESIAGVVWDSVASRLSIAIRRPGGPGKPAGHLVAEYAIGSGEPVTTTPPPTTVAPTIVPTTSPPPPSTAPTSPTVSSTTAVSKPRRRVRRR